MPVKNRLLSCTVCRNRYMKRFAKTVVKVLTAYADLLKNDFPNHLRDERTVCIFF